MNQISPLAYINPNAKLGDNCRIDAFAFVDEDTIIGDGCHIRPHVSILGGSRLGKGVKVYEGSVISAEPQDFRWKGDRSEVYVGDNTVIREHVIINRSIRSGMATRVGSNCFVMAQTHIGHDSEIGDYCVLGNAVKVAGDCHIDNYSILSSGALVHELCDIGKWVFVKGGCRVNSHVPPFVIMAHNPISFNGVNAKVMSYGKYSDDEIDNVAKCYRHLYQTNTSAFNAVKRMEVDVEESPERNEIMAFIRNHNYKLAALSKHDQEKD